MVYGIGKAHGVELDQGHIKEFIAAAGVGMTSQYLEQFGRKLLGGLLGKVAGRTIGGLGGAATGMAFSFATTYALGQVAKRYYAGGRVMSTAMLRDTFQNLLGPAKQMQSQYLPQIQQKAATLDAAKVMAMVRGGWRGVRNGCREIRAATGEPVGGHSGWGVSRSASVTPSSTAKNARMACASTPCKRQWLPRQHWLVRGSKHSTRWKSVSVLRTTAPTLISCAGFISRMPPPRPRVVSSRPWAASSCTILVRWLREMPWLCATSLMVTGCSRPW